MNGKQHAAWIRYHLHSLVDCYYSCCCCWCGFISVLLDLWLIENIVWWDEHYSLRISTAMRSACYIVNRKDCVCCMQFKIRYKNQIRMLYIFAYGIDHWAHTQNRCACVWMFQWSLKRAFEAYLIATLAMWVKLTGELHSFGSICVCMCACEWYLCCFSICFWFVVAFSRDLPIK